MANDLIDINDTTTPWNIDISYAATGVGLDGYQGNVEVSNISDMNITVTESSWVAGIYGEDNVNITNSIIDINMNGIDPYDSIYGVKVVNERLDIIGGKLTVTMPETAKGFYVAGVNSEHAYVNIKDAIIDMDLYNTSTAYETEGETYITGIDAWDNDIMIDGGSIDIKGTSSYDAWGIYSQYDSTIKNVDKLYIDVVGKEGDGYGVHADDEGAATEVCF